MRMPMRVIMWKQMPGLDEDRHDAVRPDVHRSALALARHLSGLRGMRGGGEHLGRDHWSEERRGEFHVLREAAELGSTESGA